MPAAVKYVSVTLLAMVSPVVAYVAVEGVELYTILLWVPWAVAVFGCEPEAAVIGPFVQ